jgi:hypothetical protein
MTSGFTERTPLPAKSSQPQPTAFNLKTEADTVTIKFSSKTKFEHDKEAVDKSLVRKATGQA